MIEEDWSSIDGRETHFGRVHVLDAVESTQDEARRLIDSGEPGVVLAKRQLKGRGRQGRVWLDADGAALSMSLPIRTELPPAGLSIAVGLGVLEGCRDLGASGLALKWPNDIVERTESGPGRKLAGVLIESFGDWAVAGIGINVRPIDAAELATRATSLADLGSAASRPDTAAIVLQSVAETVGTEPNQIRDLWHTHSALRGHRCQFRVEGRPVQGVVVEMDPQWRLVLQAEDGSRLRIDAAYAHFEEVLTPRG